MMGTRGRPHRGPLCLNSQLPKRRQAPALHDTFATSPVCSMGWSVYTLIVWFATLSPGRKARALHDAAIGLVRLLQAVQTLISRLAAQSPRCEVRGARAT